MNNETVSWKEVLEFWFEELTPKQWYVKEPGLDATIVERFGVLHSQASVGECWGWRANTLGRLAEIIVLDQFSRNIYRDCASAFALDSVALVLAQEAIALNVDKELTPEKRSFLYLPFMHSESLAIHEEAVRLFSQEGMESNYEFELKHKVIIERFGRYPHRNEILGRESTEEELEFLRGPGSSF